MAQETESNQNIQANNNSIAVGGISIGGSISGNLTIGNTGFSADQVSALIAQISATFQPRAFDGRCPYKGLDVFEEADAELFFGREKLVQDLVSRVKESRTVFITGPSGSGKSSLVRAGLIHALKLGAIQETCSERWLYEMMKPGRDPLTELARVASRLAVTTNAEDEVRLKAMTDKSIFARWCEIALKEGRDRRAVIFIDQFEEVFTQISRDDERIAFLDLLTHTAEVDDGRVVLLFSMRSDFIPNCATYPRLNALLNRQFVQIGAMQPEELVSAIAQPALRVGLKIDPDLIAQIINDMKGEPGALPLMQFALKDLFDESQKEGGLIALTLDSYFRQGGIQKSLERHANAAFGKLDKSEQELARSIFSGLIEVGRGTQDTKRTAIFDELIPANASAGAVEAIVQKLADARLITTDEAAGKDTVTISHEKLIDAWPWLKKLVNENRDVIALQNEITEDAREWEEHQRDASYLYTGARLANAHEQLAAKKLTLSGLAQEFVVTSQAEQERETQARLEKEKQVAVEQATTKRLRTLTYRLLAIFSVVFIGTYIWFYNYASTIVLKTIEDNLIQTVEGAINLIDTDGFVKLYEEESTNNPDCSPSTGNAKGYYPEDNPLYMEHLNWLYTVQQAAPSTRIYTYVKGPGPGDIVAIGSTGYFRTPRGGFKFCELYNSNGKTLIEEGLIHRVDRWTVYSDSYGRWITTYHPITDKNGNIVGAIGMDVSADLYSQVRNAILRPSILSFVVTYIILFILIYISGERLFSISWTSVTRSRWFRWILLIVFPIVVFPIMSIGVAIFITEFINEDAYLYSAICFIPVYIIMILAVFPNIRGFFSRKQNSKTQ